MGVAWGEPRSKNYAKFVLCTTIVRCASYAIFVSNGAEAGGVILAFDPDRSADEESLQLDSKTADSRSGSRDTGAGEPHPWIVGVSGGYCVTGSFTKGVRKYSALLTLHHWRTDASPKMYRAQVPLASI